MKTNHEKVLNFIRQAIAACKEDHDLEHIKKNLYAILKSTETISNKRNHKKTQSEIFAAEAKKNQEKWLEMLKKNFKMPEIIYDEERDD